MNQYTTIDAADKRNNFRTRASGTWSTKIVSNLVWNENWDSVQLCKRVKTEVYKVQDGSIHKLVENDLKKMRTNTFT